MTQYEREPESMRKRAGSEEPKRAHGRYRLEDGAYTITNGEFFYNRPLYMTHRPAAILAGDRPALRYLSGHHNGGVLLLGLRKGERIRWLHDFPRIVARYIPGRMLWELEDAQGECVRLEAVADGDGAFLRVAFESPGAWDALCWLYGGANLPEKRSHPGMPIFWSYDPALEANRFLIELPFFPEDCTHARLQVTAAGFVCAAMPERVETTDGAKLAPVIGGACSLPSAYRIVDAMLWREPEALCASEPGEYAAVWGSAKLSGAPTVYFELRELGAGSEWMPRTDYASAHDAACARAEALAHIVTVHTPDARLDLAVAASCIAMDACWYPPVYHHGGMAWNVPYPGWRTLYGPTAYGWHENVRAQARHYIAYQIRESEKTAPQADPAHRLMLQSAESCYFGKGRIDRDQSYYNFQTQFFDMLVHAWRFTGDPELEALLFPALELHLEWQRRCFDADGNGVYESYINSWPTDCVWYGGGETAQETAYAYAGVLAAARMAERQCQPEKAATYRERAAWIRKNLLKSLWIPEKGYLAEYRDTLGHKRRHDDACLYSVFLPIDAGLFDPFQAAQALYYTEWGLERQAMELGGQMCWGTNWAPYIWSVRELYQGDVYHLALAYFQNGQSDAGWELLQGAYRESFYDGVVPGTISAAGSTDFNDSSSLFCRTIVEGLFGYRPDAVDGVVTVAPAFPTDWREASIETPDFRLRFARTGNRFRYAIELTKPAALRFMLGLNAYGISELRVNGAAAEHACSPGIGQLRLCVETASLASAVLEFRVQGDIPCAQAEFSAEAGAAYALTNAQLPGLRVVELYDPQGIFDAAEVCDGALFACIGDVEGHQLCFVRCEVCGAEDAQFAPLESGCCGGVHAGDAMADGERSGRGDASCGDAVGLWVPVKLYITHAERRAYREWKYPRSLPYQFNMVWRCVDMSAAFNGDVRAVYTQRYLSPRPDSCSVQIGVDGYSGWCMSPWGDAAPEIRFENLPALLRGDRLYTPQAVPFLWHGKGDNIAFTSLWENWPERVTVPIGRKGRALWFLVCGTTTPMQTGIENGRLTVRYADGQEDILALTPPHNYIALAGFKREGAGDYLNLRHRGVFTQGLPEIVQLGSHCRAVLLGLRLEYDAVVESVTLETLSNDVVIGLMGVTVQER